MVALPTLLAYSKYYEVPFFHIVVHRTRPHCSFRTLLLACP